MLRGFGTLHQQQAGRGEFESGSRQKGTQQNMTKATPYKSIWASKAHRWIESDLLWESNFDFYQNMYRHRKHKSMKIRVWAVFLVSTVPDVVGNFLRRCSHLEDSLDYLRSNIVSCSLNEIKVL